MNGQISSDLNNLEQFEDNSKPKKKRKLSQLEKDIIKLNYLSNLKIKKHYNCTKKTYDKYIINCLLNNSNCHLVSIFKEKMLLDYVDEFLRRQYTIKESSERIPKFAIYYKNYLLFFCQPTFSNFVINDIINDYGERRGEIYYKNNYQGGKSNENEDLGFEESDSEEETEKDNKFKINDNGEIFDESIKENIDNVTIMTTINNSKNNTINLNLNNEKIEVFSENKCDKSNDTTLHELMDIVKKGQQEFNNKKNNNNNKIDNNTNTNVNNNIDNNNINNNENNNSTSNNYTNNNFNKSKKSNKKNKKKKNILNIIDYKKAMLNKGVGHSQSKKKEGSKSVKKHLEKNNIDINLQSKVNKLKNKFSIKFQKLFKKGGNNKNLNINKINYKFPINNFLNIVNDKNNNHEKLITNSNANLKKMHDREIKDKEKDKLQNKNEKKKVSNHSVNLNLKNKSVSKDKEPDKKYIKKNGNNNRFYSIKNSYGNINNNNNILQNNFHKPNNNYNFYIGGYGTNKNNSKSRNNTGFLYKQHTNTNNIINNNIIYNLNNIYNTTSLHKLYKNIKNNIHNNGYAGKINPFKTLNFMQTTNHHQRYNNNFIQIHNNNDNKYHISNTSQENKSSSLKILVTDLNNPNHVKPTIKLQNEKDLIKSKYNNRENCNLFDLNNNKNHRITKSYNNLNLNNIHITNNGITSYNNMKYKNKKFHNNSKINNQLKNIKGNQINSNSSNKNKKTEGNNKELMQLALSLLIDNNNSTFSNMVGNNNNNNNNILNNNYLLNKKSFIGRNSNKKNSIKKNKNNYNNKNKYQNNNTNYNININNQININTNPNNIYNNLKSGKDYLNTKIKNQELNINNNNIKDIYSNNFLNTNSNLHISSCNANNNNHNSENINLNRKIRTRNFNSGLKKGNILLNKNSNNNPKNEENIIKSYHTKSVSSLTDLINHNKKIMGLYKNISKSKSKEHKKNF